MPFYAGVMSGTSLDGADAVIVEISDREVRTLGAGNVAFPQRLRERLLALCNGQTDSLDEAGGLEVELSAIYADAVSRALKSASVAAGQLEAIGCHGQTVRHRPERGYTIQLNDPSRLAERTGVDVVADFRSRDLAAGGQGAPLVPAFHDCVFRATDRSRAIVNIGGIANISFLPCGGRFSGFDCGPGNVLLDSWSGRHLGKEFDLDGAWSAQGTENPTLLRQWLADPYFDRPPPKSTGREHFNAAWLDRYVLPDIWPEDVQATLVALTATAIAEGIERHGKQTQEIYLCGGGAHNRQLAVRIAEACGGRPVKTTEALGIPPEQVEAAAFAWLAMKCVRREPVDLTSVTGARGPRILGAIYPA